MPSRKFWLPRRTNASACAVVTYRSLTAEPPAVFHPHLAQSLTNLSNVLSGLDHMPEALEAIREAVNLFRPLAMERPVVFLGKLANSFYMLSRYYSVAVTTEVRTRALARQVKLECLRKHPVHPEKLLKLCLVSSER